MSRAADLRPLLPVQIVTGGYICADGAAVGLVVGGAPSWELAPEQERSDRLNAYHHLLMALDTTIKVAVIDQALDLQRALGDLGLRHQQTHNPVAAAILSEVTDEIAAATEVGATGAKQVIWEVRVERSALLRPRGTVAGWGRSVRMASSPSDPTLPQAIDRARRLAESLRVLGGSPAPHLMSADQIAHLWWQVLDPMRARRVPLADRMHRLLTPVIATSSHES